MDENRRFALGLTDNRTLNSQPLTTPCRQPLLLLRVNGTRSFTYDSVESDEVRQKHCDSRGFEATTEDFRLRRAIPGSARFGGTSPTDQRRYVGNIGPIGEEIIVYPDLNSVKTFICLDLASDDQTPLRSARAPNVQVDCNFFHHFAGSLSILATCRLPAAVNHVVLAAVFALRMVLNGWGRFCGLLFLDFLFWRPKWHPCDLRPFCDLDRSR